MSLTDTGGRWSQGHTYRDLAFVRRARGAFRRPLVRRGYSAWKFVAWVALCGASSGCTQILFDGTRARVDEVAPQDSSVADVREDGIEDVGADSEDGDIDVGDLGIAVDAFEAFEAAVPQPDTRIPSADAGPGPFGPWNFLSEDDLAGWEVIAPLGGLCTMERDPTGSSSLKLTFTSPSCILAHANKDLDLHDRRLKVRIRGEGATSNVNNLKLFAQAGTVVVKDEEYPVSMVWQERSFLIDAPGAPDTYDPTKVQRFGALLEGEGGTMWLDSIELVKEEIRVPLPDYDFTDSLGELGIFSTEATNVTVDLSDGYAVVKGTLGKLSAISFGQASSLDLSRAHTLRARFRTVGAPNTRIFMASGPAYTWRTAPMEAKADYSQWTEVAWDVRDVSDREYVRKWGFELYGVEGDVELHVDWLRFEEAPPAADAGPETDEAGSGDAGVVDSSDSTAVRADAADTEGVSDDVGPIGMARRKSQ